MGKDLYRDAMANIYQKVALQEIRKVVRGKDSENVKLEKICTIIHSYEDDVEQAEIAAERRAIEEEEAAEEHERIKDMFDDMVEPVNRLFECKTGDSK